MNSDETRRSIAVSTVLFDGYSRDVALAAIAASGVTCVEPAYIAGYVDFDEDSFSVPAAQDLRREVERHGLACPAISAHMDIGRLDDETSAMLARRIRFAAEVGARFLISNAGLAADADLIRRRVENVLPLCRSSGIILALENPGHGQGALICDAASGSALVREFDDPFLRQNYDAGNVFTYSAGGLQPAVDLARNGTREIGYVHLKDVIDDRDGWRFCAVGEGLIDHAALMPLLPVGLPVSMELPLRLARPGKGDPVRAEEPLRLEALGNALARARDHLLVADRR